MKYTLVVISINRRPVMITNDNQIDVYNVEQDYSSKSITFGTSKTNCNLRWLNKYVQNLPFLHLCAHFIWISWLIKWNFLEFREFHDNRCDFYGIFNDVLCHYILLVQTDWGDFWDLASRNCKFYLA